MKVAITWRRFHPGMNFSPAKLVEKSAKSPYWYICGLIPSAAERMAKCESLRTDLSAKDIVISADIPASQEGVSYFFNSPINFHSDRKSLLKS